MSTAIADGIPGGPYVAALPVNTLFVDATYQREAEANRVRTMVETFDRRLVGVLEVSARPDGTYAILDGQHRHAVLSQLDPYAAVACQIHEDLTVADEAELFHLINVRRKTLTWWDRWRARRAAGEPAVIAIDQVLDTFELRVHPTTMDGSVRATKALETIVAGPGGAGTLDRVLDLLTSVYGRDCDAFTAPVMGALAMILTGYTAGELDPHRLVLTLRKTSSPLIRARAAALRQKAKGTLPRLCAAIIIDDYNRGAPIAVPGFFQHVPITKAIPPHVRRAAAASEALDELAGSDRADVPPVAATGPTDSPPAPSSADPGHGSATPAAEPARPALTSVPPPVSPILAMCQCGHTQRRHPEPDGICVAGNCECSVFTLATD